MSQLPQGRHRGEEGPSLSIPEALSWLSGKTAQRRSGGTQGSRDHSSRLRNLRENSVPCALANLVSSLILPETSFSRHLYSSTWKTSQQCSQQPSGPPGKQSRRNPRNYVLSEWAGSTPLGRARGAAGRESVGTQEPRAPSLIHCTGRLRARTFSDPVLCPA